MPIPISRPRAGALIAASAALISMFVLAGIARASVPVDLRVVDSSGSVLGDYTQYTDKVTVKTDTKANCFGEGTEGSGDKVKVKGATALGAVVDGAAAGDTDLKPISVTDAFDFGLGVCGIGGEVAPATGFWLLKQNYVETQTGGDQTKVKRNDAITWFLDPDFADAPPAELLLDAPARTTLGDPTQVQVFEYDSTGTHVPAPGVTVTGASQPTGADGTTTIEVTSASTTLVAKRDGAISDASQICAAGNLGDCPKAAAGIIGGSAEDDEIKGGKGPDVINAGKGNDKIDAQDGESDDIDCGGGKDKVEADAKDKTAKNCEKVRD
jgi:hypothetical protein